MMTAESGLSPPCELKYLRALGSGSFGDAFLVEDLQKRRFVVKRIRDGRVNDSEALAESNMRGLGTDHVVKLHDIWRDADDGCLCLRMEYCNGGSLESLLAKSYPLPERTVTAFFVQLLIALDHIHLRHLVHRDIKPENILLHNTHEGGEARIPTVKIGDFGVSKRLAHTDSPTASRAGTPLYYSPELLCGHRYTRKTDVWSLGVTLYQVLTHRVPFAGKTMVDLTRSVLHDEPAHPSVFTRAGESPAYSRDLGDVVLQMLNKSRSSRPSPRDLLARPVFAAVFMEWPWKSRAFHECVGVFACRKRAVVNVRAEPSVDAEKIGSVRYGDQLFVQRRVTVKEAPGEGREQVVWLHVVGPYQGYCVLGCGTERLFQLFQDPSPLTTGKSISSSSSFGNEDAHSPASLSCSVDPASISPLFYSA